ncbi:MAG: hypothetical protein N3I35_03445 [Clostridia bacterium]|nr:hypothetical protein [Clostridia bacterium]
MINDINLLPDKILYRKQRIIHTAFKVFAVVLLITAIGYGLLNIRLQRMDMEKRVADISATIDNSALKALSDAENSLAQKIKESKELEKMLSGVPSDKTKVTELIERVSGIMPATITATSIKYAAGSGGEIEFGFSGENRADLSLLLKKLHDDNLYENINISRITGKISPFSVTVTIQLKKEVNNKNSEAKK